jgi:hypothetical protein
VRQLLADKVSGNQVGIWLLAPEHLRLGSWALLCAWSQGGGERVEPRLALHLVHEAALCLGNLRRDRSLSQKGFELANGLPFVPSDPALHRLLECHSLAEAPALQVALGQGAARPGPLPGPAVGYRPPSAAQQHPTPDASASGPGPAKAPQSAPVFFLPGRREPPAALLYGGLFGPDRGQSHPGTAGPL